MADYKSGDNIVGKLQIQYEDTNGDKFTETPFYIHGNLLMTEGSNTELFRQRMQDRIYYAMAQMDSLANNTNISAKVLYEFDLTVPE